MWSQIDSGLLQKSVHTRLDRSKIHLEPSQFAFERSLSDRSWLRLIPHRSSNLSVPVLNSNFTSWNLKLWIIFQWKRIHFICFSSDISYYNFQLLSSVEQVVLEQVKFIAINTIYGGVCPIVWNGWSCQTLWWDLWKQHRQLLNLIEAFKNVIK